MQLDPAFRALLHPDDLELLAGAPETIFATWADLRLCFTNSGWRRFARDNGADEQFFDRWQPGASLASIFERPGSRTFAEAFASALSSFAPTACLYECSSPTRRRLFHATFLPLGDDMRCACLIHHAPVLDLPASVDPANAKLLERYQHADGMLCICAQCHRLRRAADQRWEHLPAPVAMPPRRTSHGLCEGCASWLGAPRALPRTLRC